jgi:class 3 adenylate cyclase
MLTGEGATGVAPADVRQRILACPPVSVDDAILAGISNADFAGLQDFVRREKLSLLTILFDDIVGSTALGFKLGEREHQRLRKEHDDTVQAILTKHGDGKGEIILI